ncbi:caspase domain-containing protein [Streptomyces collinus]|uniref:caspase family protein n=1 Tax=Streptomyces collinus TaxID=42684 RepID=UPI0036467EB8
MVQKLVEDFTEGHQARPATASPGISFSSTPRPSVLAKPTASRAILVGVHTYSHLDNLPATRNNLRGLRDILTNSLFCGLPQKNCVILDNPSDDAEIISVLADLAQEATDTLIFYFAGHGFLHERRAELHLAVSTTEKFKLWTSLDFAWIRDQIAESRAPRRVIILDCCYSGAAIESMSSGDDIAGHAAAEGTYTITASSAHHKAVSVPGADYTAFTGQLLDAVINGVDRESDILDLNDLFGEIRARLRERGYPQPQRAVRNEGERIPLFRNVSALRKEWDSLHGEALRADDDEALAALRERLAHGQREES